MHNTYLNFSEKGFNSFKEFVFARMKLNSSPKIFENYKCDYPNNTIKKIEEGFKKLGLEIVYNENKVGNSVFTSYLGSAFIDILGWGQYGKGNSSVLAKASAYAELVERFSTGCFELKIPFPKKPEEYSNLLKDVNEKIFLKGFTKNNNQNLTSLNVIDQYFYKKLSKEDYETFKKEGLFDFLVDGYSLINNKQVKIPIHFVDLISNTNGLASGNTLEEAIVQAALEIFERHASIKIMSNKITCPTIDFESIQDETIQKFIKMLKSSNIDVVIKDFTLNNIIPVIGVLFVNHNLENDKNKLKKDRDYKRINVGAHVNLNEAIMRCFLEYLQVLDSHKEKLDVLYFFWTEMLNKKYRGSKDTFRFYVKDFDYYKDLTFLEKGKNISFNSLNSIENNDSLEDLRTVVDICKNNNCDFVVVDYTHKVLCFPTVRVLIPPVSTDFDPFGKKILKMKNLEKRFNYYHGIKDLYRYVVNDSWVKNRNKIEKLIENVEEYLSAELDHFYINIIREKNFSQQINLFHVLLFLYLSIDQYGIARKYFEMLKELNLSPIVPSLDLIKNNFELKSNPFDFEKSSKEVEKQYSILLKNLNDSFR